MAPRKDNYKKINLKRKRFSRTPARPKGKRMKHEEEAPEVQIAREKDIFDFTDSEDEADITHFNLADMDFLSSLNDSKQKKMIALTQDVVRPFYVSETDYKEQHLLDALADLNIPSFRPNQRETIKRILLGKSTLFVSPTGSGKSLCYQLPALLYWKFRKYVTIVVSPLISLMEDQIENFPSTLKPVCIHSGLSRMQKKRSIEQLVEGQAQVVFISPEAIVGGFLDLDDLRVFPPVGFVCIDEAHCLSEWSHNFRPAYLQFFKVLNEHMNIKTYLGLTATATKTTIAEIAKNLNVKPNEGVIGSTYVPENLLLSVSCEDNKELAIIDLLKSNTFKTLTSIIVYCNRRDEAESLAMRIRTAMQKYSTLVDPPENKKRSSLSDSPLEPRDNIDHNGKIKLSWHAEPYHAGLSMDTRKRVQRQFVKGELRVVCATVAFGMGINKSNVRAVIHYDMPNSFESYVQEIGRAGRDGKTAQCHMFLKSDMSDLFYQQRNIYENITERKSLKSFLGMVFKRCKCENMGLKQSEQHNKSVNQQQQKEHDGTSTLQKFNGQEQQDSQIDDKQSQENAFVGHTNKSLVRKNRICTSHEVAFEIEDAVNIINLKAESIVTLLCKIQKTYPQLKLELFPPTKSTVELLCYKGQKQMEALEESCPPVKYALFKYRNEKRRETGCKLVETPNKLKFDVVEIAQMGGMPTSEVIRSLKKTEWEFVGKTGNFKRSQVRVKLMGNAFHIKVVGDVNNNEFEDILSFLFESQRSYERSERLRIRNFFDTMISAKIPLKEINNKSIRLETSSRLKQALSDYFNDNHGAITNESALLDANASVSSPSKEENEEEEEEEEEKRNATSLSKDDLVKISGFKRESIKKDISAFLSAHWRNKEFVPRIIARIFQGVSTPNYPAEHWGPNKKWWRRHLDVDFNELVSLIREQEVGEMMEKRALISTSRSN